MKKEIEVCYKNSGVNLTKGFSIFFNVLGLLMFFAFIIFLLLIASDYEEIYFTLSILSFISTLSCLAIGAILESLSSIAKTALYQRAIMEQDYAFKVVAYIGSEECEEEDSDENSIDEKQDEE